VTSNGTYTSDMRKTARTLHCVRLLSWTDRKYAIGAVAHTKSVTMFEMACVYGMPMRIICDQHFLLVIRMSQRDARGRPKPKCCVAGSKKLKTVANTMVP
jgi:hypothetical protein